MYIPVNYLARVMEPFSSASKFLLFYSDLAVFIFPTLFADIFKDPMKSRHRAPTLWVEFQIARA